VKFSILRQKDYMLLAAQIRLITVDALKHLFPGASTDELIITINETKPEFNGNYTVVLFPFVKALRQKPDALGKMIGDYFVERSGIISSYEIVSGFLNLTIKDEYCSQFLINHYSNTAYGERPKTDRRVMVEYSSPNTNKPLHFGHLRNNFLGLAVAEILKAVGNEVIKANLVNDRGIHICKSMIAWQLYANGATPESTGIKGDHLVGDYYVQFNKIYKQQIAELVAEGMDEDAAEKEALIMKQAQDLLRKWEAGDEAVIALWRQMNGWVYEGFETTYKRLGIDFDQIYYESNTYLLGKQIVEDGLQQGVLFKKADNSVWIDLTEDGLDQKLLLRGDGTSVYMTQDLGTAVLKYNDFKLDESIYVIADEQNYHMQVLKLILQKLHQPCADGIYHLSYGMVELPTGRMKSREGTVVDADDMIDEMLALAKEKTLIAGKTESFTQEELEALYETIGLGALKFYLLRVEPKKKMIFNPEESIDLHGYTATFIQYAHARICSLLRREGIKSPTSDIGFQPAPMTAPLARLEKELVLALEQYPAVTDQAAKEYNPSAIANYCFRIAQLFNSFYDEHSISKAESEEKKRFRLMLVMLTAHILRHGMALLGIRLPEKM
jgi:arginyl-tRNA synthetase